MVYNLHPDKIVSRLTGNQYHFKRDHDGSSRRSATRQLEADDLVFIEAANARAIKAIGRSLSISELQSGGWLRPEQGNPNV